jgi:hypothetical protein
MTEEMLGPGGEPVGEPPAPSRLPGDLRDWFVVALLAVVAVRIIASVVAGIVEWARSSTAGVSFVPTRYRVGSVLMKFSEFGDGIGGLLLLAVAFVIYSRVRSQGDWYRGRSIALLAVVLSGLTAIGAVLNAVGWTIYLTGAQGREAAAIIQVDGLDLANVLLASLTGLALYRLTWRLDEQIATIPDEPDGLPDS